MPTSRQNLRRGLSQWMGDFILDPDGSVPTTSGNGGASGITAIDVLLSYYGDDYFNEWFFILPTGPTDGNGSYEVTRVVDFTSVTLEEDGTVTPSGTLTLEPDASALVASGQTYELHRYSPAWKHLALNAAREQAADVLWTPVLDATLIVDNLLTNSDFETVVDGGEITGWTRENAPTLTSDTNQIAHGSYSLQVAAGASVGRVYGGPGTLFERRPGKTIYFQCWVYATVADTARIGLSTDGGSSYTYSPYASTLGSLELLEVNVSLPDDISGSAPWVRCALEVAANQTARFDLAVAWIEPVARYTRPSTLYRGPQFVKQQVDKLRPDGEFLPLTRNNRPISGRLLQLHGKGLLSEVTTEAGTMEVAAPETQLLYAHALRWLAESNVGMASGVSREQYERDRQLWLQNAAILESRANIKRVKMGFLAEQNGVWFYENDELVLTSGRA